jgi:hypothetical protein
MLTSNADLRPSNNFFLVTDLLLKLLFPVINLREEPSLVFNLVFKVTDLMLSCSHSMFNGVKVSPDSPHLMVSLLAVTVDPSQSVCIPGGHPLEFVLLGQQLGVLLVQALKQSLLLILLSPDALQSGAALREEVGLLPLEFTFLAGLVPDLGQVHSQCAVLLGEVLLQGLLLLQQGGDQLLAVVVVPGQALGPRGKVCCLAEFLLEVHYLAVGLPLVVHNNVGYKSIIDGARGGAL